MATRVEKSQSLYPTYAFVCFIMAFLCSVFALYYQSYTICLMGSLLIFIGIIIFIVHTQKIKKYMNSLIQVTNAIIEGKEEIGDIIDGESYIAVLSSHLHILDTRMKGMVERLKQEQSHLKDYIEDISHQIKTPLTSMLLKEEMLLEIIEEPSQKHLLSQIYSQTEKIKDLIESLLHLAQIESHSIEYHKHECDLEEILHSIDEILYPLKEKYNVLFKYHHVNQNIYCDEKWMSEALENIIKNCIEQKKDSYIDISCYQHASYTEIHIQDHGDGFKQEDMPHIFERFYRGQSQKGEGIGIGLSMSQGIIEGHHGHIEVMNHNGALFKIILPNKNTKSKFIVTNEKEFFDTL